MTITQANVRKRDRWNSSDEDEEEFDNNHDDDLDEDVVVSIGKTTTILSSLSTTTTESTIINKKKKRTILQNQNNADKADKADHKKTGNNQNTVTDIMMKKDSETVDSKNSDDIQSLPLPPKVVKYHNPLLKGCRSVYDCYERLNRVDEGTYGVVWKARDIATNKIVALKQIKFDDIQKDESFPMAALREINVLLALNHENIVSVKEMVVGKKFSQVYMVMEYMDMDLQQAMKQSGTSPFQQSELKSMLYDLLLAIHHIHEKWILHRDVKTSNILVKEKNKGSIISLCDFGLARKYQIPFKALTQQVVTLWYRPPELLFGEKIYGPEVDMWSVGCVFGELLRKEAILRGKGELDQIDLVFQLVGNSDFECLPYNGTFQWKKRTSQLKKKFQINASTCWTIRQTFLDSNGFNLLSQLLTLHPKKRITAKEALNHKYFTEGVEQRRPLLRF